MNKKSILIFFLVFAVLQVTEELNLGDNWFVTTSIQFAICFVIFIVFSLIWTRVTKKKT
ncbi:Na+/proline symporter [Alkalibacillus flavidus]|uniref:Na+/proline symporter n=1 Tax=Alkalibacillus flavidus TaxID=546021 RepID=A0ABV2KY13_9BACI